ncbi:uncharacterized protein DUF1329 [Panacagrimonas perspica]|uniref:Uncharacterized protein DUF1329 n=1 Tax=Panacagrimonas perspica TaxID=381431 RepID=A0A4R7PC90_9GAMM|nr:uncharacterized protein DUF1329 [Panacagrimonas perspica]THD03091.1 hypothetical protein B1810_10890 [Panacagrimonas perspica]
MRIRKYDFDYGRRALMEKVVKGAGAAGVLGSLWPMIGNGADITKAYPDELTSIEMFTKGKIKTGDKITAANVEIVKDLLDPICYQQVKTMGRVINIVPTSKDPSVLFPHDYLQASLKNKGRAKLDDVGNVFTDDGSVWIGGLPFPEPKSGLEAAANITLSWGRHDFALYAIRDWDLGPDGEDAYQYDYMWAEQNVTGRLDGQIFGGRKDLLRNQNVWFTAPNDSKGSSFLSVWYADQRKYPDLYGYFPAFKRVRQFPTNQRFEPLAPGITFFLTDAWGAGDPMLTWGNYKIVSRGPHLAATSNNWLGGSRKNWEKQRHGGAKGKTFFETYMQLVPEVIVLEANPTGYPRAPVSKKVVYIDARNGQFCGYVTYDRRGALWKSFEPGMSQFKDGDVVFKEPNGYPAWSWVHVLSHDIQNNRMSLLNHINQATGGLKTTFSDPNGDAYNLYLTTQSLTRLGR